jgi:hypothetical protein
MSTHTRSAQRTGTLTVGVASLAMLLLAACGGSDPVTGTGSDAPAAPAPDATAAEPAAPADGTPIRLSIGTTVLTARLHDNPTARDLLAHLPLTLAFRDLNGVEKIARLPRALTMDGVPAGADPEIRDIGYYAPSNNVVLYYGDVGYWNGIVRIGQYDGNTESVQGLEDGTAVTIERAN